MKPTSTLLLLLAVVLPLLLPLPVHAQQSRSYTYADAHLHYVDFFQESEGIDALVRQMNRSRISNVVLMGLPVIKMWAATEPKRPVYVFADDAKVYWYSLTDEILARAVNSLPEKDRQRIHPFISGFNPVDKLAVEHVKRMLDWYPNFWQGIGEVMTRHDDLSAFGYGESPRANHEALNPIFELAAQRDLPVLLHSNITSLRLREPLYLGELEQSLQRHPGTRFIWAHAGTSDSLNRRMDLNFLDNEVERLLKSYDNLWIDLSWSVLDEYLLTSDQEEVRSHWLKLIRKYPRRFLIGSDLVGKFGNLGKKLGGFDTLLDELNARDARRLAHDNLFDVLPRRASR